MPSHPIPEANPVTHQTRVFPDPTGEHQGIDSAENGRHCPKLAPNTESEIADRLTAFACVRLFQGAHIVGQPGQTQQPRLPEQ